MAGIKSFIDKVKEKNTQFQIKQKEKQAASKGFSSAQSYNMYSGIAKTAGEEEAKATLRKKELKRIKDEAREEAMMGRYGKYGKMQKKVQKGFQSFQKGTGIYNEMMGELQSLGSGGNSFYPTRNSNQAYASGYGAFAKPQRIKSTKKKQSKKKTKSRSKPRQNNFWSQFQY